MNMMRMVLAVSAIVAVSVSYAHTPAETNAVLGLMLGGSSTYMSFDNYNDDMPTDIPDYRRQSVFFEVYTNEDWTVGEKQGVFDDYLNQLSVANGGVTNEMFRYANTALRQCNLMSYTNAVSALRRVAINPYLSRLMYRGSAITAAVRMGGVSDEATAFVEHIMTNSVPYSRYELVEASETNETLRANAFPYTEGEKKDACLGYVRLLSAATNSAEAVRGVRMLYRNREDSCVAVGLDRFFERKVTGYANSSNRLEFLSWTISNFPGDGGYWGDSERIRLIAVTNQLMQLEQPLPEVESFRGL